MSYKVERAAEKHTNALMSYANVCGVGTCEKHTGGINTGVESISVLVTEKKPIAELAPEEVIPPYINGIPTDVIVAGNVNALTVFGGDSVGHFAITAGTVGCSVIDRVTKHRLLLSNNHVLANSNGALIGDAILSPGPYDGGRRPNDVIGYLARFVKIYFHGDDYPPEPEPEPEPEPQPDPTSTCSIASSVAGIANLAATVYGSKWRLIPVNMAQKIEFYALDPYLNIVDCAVSSISTATGLPVIQNIGSPTGIVDDPAMGLQLQKWGRTTHFTSDKIISKNVTIDVGYGNKVARFKNQIVAGPMSAPGDSGSLVMDMNRRAVGLLFAGSDEITVMNPIVLVLDALGVDLEVVVEDLDIRDTVVTGVV